ncbi:mitotic interactor and substrate of PLK1 [Elephas maximus indicus]|uniref:mitotic interactor and substrate of PLK1 n=1 Tax=Elephas maximus indicus TaxID=99487 RepID=UPI0021162A78|nr:mitotic interactor and substrate of PLK1 [Elephas maximus indicus]XP_049731726.1 mitotic interactor and substrate of PLK1 [Elephas maximus indicus]
MDRVTRYPIFGIPDSPRITGPALDGDISYTFKMVGVGPEETGWGQGKQPVWPASHEARLNMMRAGAPHSLHAFPGKLSPQPPYPEDEEDEEMKAYHLEDARDTFPRRPQDLERDRRAVIRGQAVRKSGTVATLRGAPDQVDRAPDRILSQLLEENAVDREQIDFLAARQQFLSLERPNKEAPRKPPSGVVPGGAPQGISQAPKAFNGPHVANGYGVAVGPQVKEVVVLERKKVRGSPAGSDVRTVAEPGPRPRAGSPEPPKETPIEREIRLAQEREADLREQRGLHRAAGHQELVEIPARSLLTKASLTEAPRRERSRSSLYVQRDIEQETQREEDHRRQGLQWGRASTPNWDSRGPQPELRRALSSDSVLNLVPDARAADPAPEVRRVDRIPPSAYQPFQSPGSAQLQFAAFGASAKPRGPSADEVKAGPSPKATGPQRRGLESPGKGSGPNEEHLKAPQKPPRADGGVVWDEYFRLRPLRFGAPDVPQEGEASHVWQWQVAGAPPLRLQKSQSSELLEREMASVLQREREVAEERRNALFPEVFSTSPGEGSGNRDSRHSSQASGITGSYSVSESPFSTPVRLHSGLVWTVEAEPDPAEAPPEAARLQRKKKEVWYAGVNPSDDINLGIVEATRVTRHKNAMAERWEAGIYASEDED